MDLKATLKGLVFAIPANQLTTNFRAEPFGIRKRTKTLLLLRNQRLFLVLLCLLAADDAVIGHQIQHDVPAHQSRLRVQKRVVIRRGFGKSSQRGSFRIIQLIERLIEIGLGGGGNTEGTVPQINAVQIDFENLVLGQDLLHLHRQQGFLDLAINGQDVAVEQHDLGDLLRNGGRTKRATSVTGEHVRHAGTGNRHHVHTAMGVEVMVFRGQEGALDFVRNSVNWDENPPLIGKLGHQPFVRRVDPADCWRLVSPQAIHAWQISHKFGVCGPAEHTHARNANQPNAGNNRKRLAETTETWPTGHTGPGVLRITGANGTARHEICIALKRAVRRPR